MKNVKGLLSVFLTVVVLLTLSVIYVSAATEESVEGYYHFAKSDGEVTITDVDTAISGEVVVPNILDGCEVVAIGKYAFEGCDKVTSITVPDCITTIHEGAFKDMVSLEKMTIPFVGRSRDSKSYFGVLGYVFGYTTEYGGMHYERYSSEFTDEKYGSISNATWQYSCRSHESDYYYYVESYYYYIPSSLKSVTVTDATKISTAAFQNCNGLVEIKLNSEISSIESYAFRNCSTLVNIKIPDAITEINPYTFYGCKAFVNFVFPEKLVSILDFAFSECDKITELKFPSSLETIGEYAFSDLKNVTELTIPNNVITIEEGAFKGMNSLKKISIPFVGRDRTAMAFKAVLGYVFGYTNSSNSTKYLGSSVGFIDKQYGNYSDAVWQYTCKNLLDNLALKYYKEQSYHYYIPSSLESVTVTDATKISTAAFMNCSNLKEVKLNENIISIGDYAFRNCTGITEMDIPETVTSIGSYGFYGCSGLTALNISNNVTSVGSSALANCNNLTVFGFLDSYIDTYCNDNSVSFIAYEEIGSISVTKLPENNQYPGKPVDTMGMEIKVVLNDGTESVITNGFTVSPEIVPDGGEQTITVSFGSAETTFNISAKGVNGVSLLNSPAKTNYVVGDTIDLTGLKLQVYYSDGTTAVATEGFAANVETLESAGNKLITVTYYGKTANFRVSVAALQATLLEIETMPSKTDYFVGDEIDTTGLVIKATYNNGKTASVTGGFTVTTVLDSAEITEIEIEHAGKTVTYPVTVTAVVSTGWTLATEPTKLKYIIGENIDTTGLTIIEYYNNGNVATITEGFTCTPANFTESGEQIATVEYNGNSAIFVVYVHDNGTWSYAGNNVFERKCGTCDEVLESKTVNLTLNSETLEMNNQDTGTLVATVTDNFECDVIFTSSDDNVVSVGENGNITAKSIGDATVTVTIKDTDITATCEITILPRAFTLTWVVDGVSTEEKLNEAAEIIKFENPKKTGYTFTGWTPEVPDIMPAEDLTFTATWTANTYDAVFDANGGKWADGAVEKTVPTAFDSQITAPEAPVKQGYIFSKWSPEVGVMDSVDGKKFVAEWMAATDTRYTVETYTMNTSGEYVKTTKAFNGTTGESVSVNPTVQTGFTLNKSKSVLSGNVAGDNSLVLKVYIDRNTYTLTTVADGVSTSTRYLYGSLIVEPATPVKIGYKFIKWDKTLPETMPAKNITLTAVFDTAYTCPDCGDEIVGESAIAEHIAAEARAKSTVSIKNNPEIKTIKYGETLRLTAIASKPDDVVICWYVDGVKKGEGTTFDLKFESGTKTVEVKLEDADGNTVCNPSGAEISDSEEVTVNAGFFQKIISFFKNLFIMDRTVIQ